MIAKEFTHNFCEIGEQRHSSAEIGPSRSV
jgi:hypothetical protein